MIRAAIVGLGWWGKHMVRRMKDSDALRIVVAVEANPAQEGFATEHGLRFTTNFTDVLGDPRSTPSSCARRIRCIPSRCSPWRAPASMCSAKSPWP